MQAASRDFGLVTPSSKLDPLANLIGFPRSIQIGGRSIIQLAMKAKTIQIAWHGRDGGKNDPIMSIDMHSSSQTLVSGGADCEVKVGPHARSLRTHYDFL